MNDFPNGTVTFLFTDVEGSTGLLERLGSRYGAVRERHDEILRTAIVDDGGRVVDTAGDGFFAVFPTPRGGVSAAVRAQRELAATDWPDGVAVAVRMGLHTGECVFDGATYVGLDVHRAARIAAAAHGGQVLLSEATRSLVLDGMPPGASLSDLGVHRLRDLTRPERLYQLTVDGIGRDFPSLRTVDARPGNLPTRLTGLVGRGDQVTQVRDLVRDHRLVTLTGPGGIGKTRLALQVATELMPTFAGGAFFVDVSSVGDPTLVPAAVAAALELTEGPGRPVAEVVTAHLREKDLLLVLDNLEQVTDAATFVEELLTAAPGVRVLVTSRVPLHLYGEQEFAVPPLALPDPRRMLDPEVVGRYEAVDLFVRRASAAQADFRLTAENAGAVAEITVRLDGLPLAIELAASRVTVLPPQRLLGRLERRLPLLPAAERNVPERQRTLRATIDWSHDLLPEVEQCLFRRLAVFAGGAGLDAVEAVANPGGKLGDTLDLLMTLVDVNLVRSLDEPGDEPRFGMLETIREYGLDQLSAGGEEHAVRRRHAEHWAELAERGAGFLMGPEQVQWIRRLDRDLDNLRAALTWTVQVQDAELGLRLGAALGDYWRLASHVREGVHRLTELLSLDTARAPSPLRARALKEMGGLHGWITDPERMAAVADEALAIYRDLGDEHGLADATEMVGWAHLQLGDLPAAQAKLTEAVDRYTALGMPQKAAATLPGLGIIAQFQGDLVAARRLFQAATDDLRNLNDLFMAAMTEIMIGGVDQLEGSLEAAEQHYDAGLSTYQGIDNVMGVSWALYSFADLAVRRGQPERALCLVGASDRLRGGTDLPALVTATLGDVGERARERFDDGAAADEAYRLGHEMSVEEAVAYVRRRRPDDVADDDRE
jgi:predicted ATPase/class 3 adenylate cyclase